MDAFLTCMGVATAFMTAAFMATVFMDVTLPLADFAMPDKWEANDQTLNQLMRLEK
jgi:hypothetical protein